MKNDLSGDVSFTDSIGNPIFLGDRLQQTNYNGEEYLATYEVVIDPSDNEICLKLISGNKKAMNKSGYSSFGAVKNGRLTKGVIIYSKNNQKQLTK